MSPAGEQPQIRNVFDFLDPAADVQSLHVTVQSLDPPDIRAHKVEMDKQRLGHTHRVELTLLTFSLSIVTLILVFCIFGAILGSPEVRKFSLSSTTYILTALISFTAGRGLPAKPKQE